ncbi:formate dehydrogenase subunit gamma [Profundibacterium mesophilum]|uniref:Formate dehydrogenase gamma subunit n=1 Tax=Profundibacterium mesophilum KAUST100406-0324 TaxID=1037889 RepID=A0A921NVG4_9RHOB|nr:formate dehydrogenase subunit gamma [Profundibacterium mesophilum]KAF0676031.1 formate dehydrogenase gamma subunit [Profundibacterium mesophilum KAUST100406-0324]
MKTEVRVRGKDFTGYRIVGAIAALLLALVFAWQLFELFDDDNLTVPEVRWGAAGDDSGVAGVLADDLITARSRLQDERYRTGPAPDGEVPANALGNEIFLTDEPLPRDTTLTRSWAMLDEDTGQMLQERQRVVGRSSLPYANAELFERPFARDWRLGLADFATHLGAIAIIGFSLLLALILAIRGRVPILEGRAHRTVKRFNLFERATHWMTSFSFIMLAITGVSIAYGDTLIRPFGDELLGATGWISTWGHPIFAPPFALGIVFMAVMWTMRNLPSRLDLHWLSKGGGFFSDDGHNPPARKFNAGQKLIFWSAILGGITMVLSGLTLMFPYYWLDLEGMSWAMLIHAILGVLLIAIFIGHIYIGTVGMQGAFWAMWGGNVDRNWAKEHHELWLAEIEDGKQGKA